MIHLTYSPHATLGSPRESEGDKSYLRYLENQREELKKAILQAPRHRLDHLATFVETHGERLSHFLEALMNYRKAYRAFRFKYGLVGLLVSALCGGGAILALMSTAIGGMDPRVTFGTGGLVAVTMMVLWLTLLLKHFRSTFHRRRLNDLDALTALENQTRRDSWQAIRDMAYVYLKKTAGRFSYSTVKNEYAAVRGVHDKGSRDIREALNELSTLGEDEPISVEDAAFLQSFRKNDEKQGAGSA